MKEIAERLPLQRVPIVGRIGVVLLKPPELVSTALRPGADHAR